MPIFYSTIFFKFELVKSYGDIYESESHQVTTDDGYILTIHRIIRSQEKNVIKRPVILFFHCFGCASDTWALRGPGQDLSKMSCNVKS